MTLDYNINQRPNEIMAYWILMWITIPTIHVVRQLPVKYIYFLTFLIFFLILSPLLISYSIKIIYKMIKIINFINFISFEDKFLKCDLLFQCYVIFTIIVFNNYTFNIFHIYVTNHINWARVISKIHNRSIILRFIEDI